jgi:hypothetical protein
MQKQLCEGEICLERDFNVARWPWQHPNPSTGQLYSHRLISHVHAISQTRFKGMV